MPRKSRKDALEAAKNQPEQDAQQQPKQERYDPRIADLSSPRSIDSGTYGVLRDLGMLDD